MDQHRVRQLYSCESNSEPSDINRLQERLYQIYLSNILIVQKINQSIKKFTNLRKITLKESSQHITCWDLKLSFWGTRNIIERKVLPTKKKIKNKLFEVQQKKLIP